MLADPSSGDPYGTGDTEDMSNVQVCYDGGTDTVGTLTNVTCTTAGTLTTTIPTLVHDAGSNTTNVYVVGDADGLGANDRAVYAVVAQPAIAGGGTVISTDDSAAADDPAVVQNVFADGTGDIDETDATDVDYNGRHSDTGVFAVQAADLTITKTSQVVWDPISCETSIPAAPTDGAECTADNPKAIPGAYIEYTITITNAGNADASNITLSDDLTAELDDFDFVVDAYTDLDVDSNPLTADCPPGQSCGILVNTTGTDEVHSNAEDEGTAPLFLDAVDDSSWNDETANAVESNLNGGTISSGSTVTLKFRVEIQ